MLATMLALASSLLGQSAGMKDVSVTAVEGEGWLRHLNRSFNETSMGKTWDLEPAPGGENSGWQLKLSPFYATQSVAGRF